VKQQKFIYKLILLFNGNIHLQKVHKRFEFWVTAYNKRYGGNTPVFPRLKSTDLTLDSDWLAGFWDAEGGFHANLGSRDGFHSRLRVKAYVDQKAEHEIMEQIARLFSVKSVTVRSEVRQLDRVDCHSKKALANVLVYFEAHPLRSKKKLVFAMWKKVARLFCESQKAHLLPGMKERVERIKKQNGLFKEEKSVLMNISWKEKMP